MFMFPLKNLAHKGLKLKQDSSANYVCPVDAYL